MIFIIVILLSLAYALFDYWGYNKAKAEPYQLIAYRVIQRIVKGGLIVGLYFLFGFKPALAFLLLGAFATHDLMYYGWAYLIGGDEGKEEARFNLTRDVIPHLWWTPVGLYRKIRYGHGLIKPPEFVTQAILGILIALGLTA